MGQQSPMSSLIHSSTPPRPSRLRECIAAQDEDLQDDVIGQYLKNLRTQSSSRPSGSRPPPPSKFASLRRTETVPIEEHTSNERPPLPTSNSMPVLPGQKFAHRRAESDTRIRSPFAGRPLARSPSATPEQPIPRCESPTETTRPAELKRPMSMTYMENGRRWMEKEEAKSLRMALEDMDLEEEKKVHEAAQEEAAELVWKHKFPDASYKNPDAAYSNPDTAKADTDPRKDYRSHLKRGSYQRTHSQEQVPLLESRKSSGVGSRPVSMDIPTIPKRGSTELQRRVSPPPGPPGTISGHMSLRKTRTPSGKSYGGLAEAVASDIAKAHRKTSGGGGSKRIMSGDKKMFMHRNDKIWEDPQEEPTPPKRLPAIEVLPAIEEPEKSRGVELEKSRDFRPAPTAVQPSAYVRKNPFSRVRMQQDRLVHSNSAPLLPVVGKSHGVGIQRKSTVDEVGSRFVTDDLRPEGRKDSDGTTRELPRASEPLLPTKKHDRIEIQRNPPSQSRKAWYMSNEPLPPTPPSSRDEPADEVSPKVTPTKNGIEVRSDDLRAATSKQRKDRSPRLPQPTMVSDKPGRPIVSFQHQREKVLEEVHTAAVEPLRISKGADSARTSPNPFFDPPKISAPISKPPLPTFSFSDDAPSFNVPHINVSSGFTPPIPIICTPDEPTIPTIVLPEEPDFAEAGLQSAPVTPGINIPPPPTFSFSGPEDSTPAPSKQPSSGRPLPKPARPLPHHSATAPLPKSLPHYTPTIRQTGALCAHCALPIAGRILSAAGERFHPSCFVCHQCHTNLECVAFYPEPDNKREQRFERIQARQSGFSVPVPDDWTEEDILQQEIEDGDEALRFYCHLDFHEFFSPRCKSCKTPIEGEVIVACGAEWHQGHFFCAQCGDPFDSTTPFVEKDGYAWCVGCHTNRYSSKCRKCRKPVTELVVKALGSDWHDRCFVCVVSDDHIAYNVERG